MNANKFDLYRNSYMIVLLLFQLYLLHHFRLVATSTEAQRPLGEFVTSQEIRTSNA